MFDAREMGRKAWHDGKGIDDVPAVVVLAGEEAAFRAGFMEEWEAGLGNWKDCGCRIGFPCRHDEASQ